MLSIYSSHFVRMLILNNKDYSGFSVSKNSFTREPLRLEFIVERDQLCCLSKVFVLEELYEILQLPSVSLVCVPDPVYNVISKSSKVGPLSDIEPLPLLCFLYRTHSTRISDNLEIVDNKSYQIRILTLRHCTDFQK